MAPEIEILNPNKRYHVLKWEEDFITDDQVHTVLDLDTLTVKDIRVPRWLLAMTEYC